MPEVKKTEKQNKKYNGKLKLYPLKFEDVVKALLETRPKPKNQLQPKT